MKILAALSALLETRRRLLSAGPVLRLGFTALLGVLFGCGGAAFTTDAHELFTPPDDAGDAQGIIIGVGDPDAADGASYAPDEHNDDADSASSTPDAEPIESGPPDAPACAPFNAQGSPNPTWCAGVYSIPGYYALVNTSSGSCEPKMPTPAACLCSDTYTCDCIAAAAGCPQNTSWVTCSQAMTGEVTLVCR